MPVSKNSNGCVNLNAKFVLQRTVHAVQLTLNHTFLN